MPPNTTVFLLGLAVGTGLLSVGIILGFWFGRKAAASPDAVDRQQFLSFLRNLSNWTTEFSGDVSKYQSQISLIREQVSDRESIGGDEVRGMLQQIMAANQRLQERLESAEEKLESQTGQISNYLTEARTDGLTGLFNRRAFDKATDDLFTNWNQSNQAFSMGLIDIDHFKQINDTYGHPAGDAVLQRVANLLQSELGDAVCVARYGGEEFGVLTTFSLDETAAMLDRVRAELGKIEVEHDGQTISLTLSAGAAQIGPDDKIGKLVRRADEALYASKLGGRNRVHLHDGTVCRLVTKIAPNALKSSSLEPQLTAAATQEAESVQSRVQERLQRIVAEESRRVSER